MVKSLGIQVKIKSEIRFREIMVLWNFLWWAVWQCSVAAGASAASGRPSQRRRPVPGSQGWLWLGSGWWLASWAFGWISAEVWAGFGLIWLGFG